MNILTIYGDPRTKKNSSRIVRSGNQTFVVPSAQYVNYERDSIRQIPAEAKQEIDRPVNVRCEYYMQTRRKVDLVNLLEATLDILVKAGVLADDNSSIVVSHDGCSVGYDKEYPRVEIEIREVHDGR